MTSHIARSQSDRRSGHSHRVDPRRAPSRYSSTHPRSTPMRPVRGSISPRSKSYTDDSTYPRSTSRCSRVYCRSSRRTPWAGSIVLHRRCPQSNYIVRPHTSAQARSRFGRRAPVCSRMVRAARTRSRVPRREPQPSCTSPDLGQQGRSHCTSGQKRGFRLRQLRGLQPRPPPMAHPPRVPRPGHPGISAPHGGTAR